MGWVSLLEDAIKRFQSDLHRLESEPPVPASLDAVKQLQTAHEVLARGHAMLYEAVKHLEMATDPSV